MPGRYGDILWALPTVRAIAQYHNTRVHFLTAPEVHFLTAPEYESLIPLIRSQDYIQDAAADSDWIIQQTAPITPCGPPDHYQEFDWQYNLGYTEWPEESLPSYVYKQQLGRIYEDPPPLALDKPWIDVAYSPRDDTVAVGFNEDWCELKMGVLFAAAQLLRDVTFVLLTPMGFTRYREWASILPNNIVWMPCNWSVAALEIASADVFLGCLSAQWVLANAVGARTVVFEPAEDRHHKIFWADRIVNGVNQNHLVLGSDNLPTFDARHVASILEDTLQEVKHGKASQPDAG
jgi:hypothetical protein